MSLYLDLTEFLSNPIMTGIQRVTGEICRYLPPNSAIPVRLRSDRYFALSSALVEAIGQHFREGSASRVAETHQFGSVENGSSIKVLPGDIVLIPEVFYDPQRVAFFRKMPQEEFERYRFIIHDLLPVTHPEYFAADMPLDIICGYFQVIRRASRCGFVSEYTRDTYYRRLKRTDARAGMVLPLGCDSLGPRATHLMLNRRPTFTVVGTIEPRKNHQLVLEAFEPLLRQIDDLRLLFIGRVGWVNSEFAQRLQALASEKNSGFQIHSGMDDAAIRSYMETSRATIYLSAAEGYGLPPVESLWVGTPVIASTAIPSLKNIGSAGVQYVEPLNVVQLRRAVLAFLDDDYANQKTEETTNVNLPTWSLFTQEVLRWCTESLF